MIRGYPIGTSEYRVDEYDEIREQNGRGLRPAHAHNPKSRGRQLYIMRMIREDGAIPPLKHGNDFHRLVSLLQGYIQYGYVNFLGEGRYTLTKKGIEHLTLLETIDNESEA